MFLAQVISLYLGTRHIFVLSLNHFAARAANPFHPLLSSFWRSRDIHALAYHSKHDREWGDLVARGKATDRTVSLGLLKNIK